MKSVRGALLSPFRKFRIDDTGASNLPVVTDRAAVATLSCGRGSGPSPSGVPRWSRLGEPGAAASSHIQLEPLVKTGVWMATANPLLSEISGKGGILGEYGYSIAISFHVVYFLPPFFLLLLWLFP